MNKSLLEKRGSFETSAREFRGLPRGWKFKHTRGFENRREIMIWRLKNTAIYTVTSTLFYQQ